MILTRSVAIALFMYCGTFKIFSENENFGVVGGNLIDSIDSPRSFRILTDSSTVEIPFSNLEGSFGGFSSVAINDNGEIVLGGYQNTSLVSNAPFFRLVSPAGIISDFPASALPEQGQVTSVAINNFGKKIIAGFDADSGDGFCKLINPDGSYIDVDVSDTFSPNQVDINSLGSGVYCSQEVLGRSYIARIFPDGSKIALINGFAGSDPVAEINDNNLIMGGGNITSSGEGYVAIEPISAPPILIVTPGCDNISCLSLNNQDLCLVGSISPISYAAFANTVGTLFPISFDGYASDISIKSVALNDFNLGLIVGKDGLGNAFAAYVMPNEQIRPFQLPDSTNNLEPNQVVLNNAGVALIAGTTGTSGNSQPYVALIAPNGSTTLIQNLPSNFSPIAVAIKNMNVPSFEGSSFGTNSSTNPLLGLSSQVLSNHLITLKSPNGSSPSNVALLVDANPKLKSNNSTPSCASRIKDSKYTLWTAPMFYNSYQQAQSGFPKITNWVGGGIVGFDYHGFENGMIGGGFAYAFDRANLAGNAGHSTYNEEFLTLYGAWMREYFYVNAALWGGYYNVNNRRANLINTVSTSNYDGWMFLPHLEVSVPYYVKECWLLADPFVMLDWANNWQSSIEETGPLGLNLVMQDDYNSLLRTEVGLRLSETATFDWGNIVFLEKGSYVNKAPFGSTTSQAIFVGGISSFGVETFSNRIQNLGVVQVSATAQPNKERRPYASLNYQGEFGSSFQSHLISVEAGINF